MLTFFGLTPEYRARLFSQIHEIVFFGKGGYSWTEVYEMPIWLRRFTWQKINEHYKEERQETEKANKQIKSAQSKIKIPNYRAKAPSK